MGLRKQIDSGHAFCILAHADERMFSRLTQRLLTVGPVYVHLDAKTDATSWQRSNPEVRFVKDPVDVYWGDWSMIEATIKVVRLALTNLDVHRVTLVSGSHYLLISESELARRGMGKENVIGASQAPNDLNGKPDAQYRTRFVRSRHPNTFRHKVVSFAVNRIIYGGRRIEWEHFVDPSRMRAGSQFWSVNREVAQYFLDRYDVGGSYVEYFGKIACPDEKFFHTIFADIDQSLRSDGTTFSKWGGGPHPLLLTQSDLENAIARDNFWFARKFESARDEDLLSWLDSQSGLPEEF